MGNQIRCVATMVPQDDRGVGGRWLPACAAEGRRKVTGRTAPSADQVLIELLLSLLDGSIYANALMPWRLPGPIRFPDDLPRRIALIEAHIQGAPCDVLYSPKDQPGRLVRVETLVLAAFGPAADGMCRWLAIDLDAADHGENGLRDPAHAARCIATSAATAGLIDGLLVSRSPGGRGMHLFLIPPAPCQLVDGVLVIAALVAGAYAVAKSDMSDFGVPHAFRSTNGTIAAPGQPGAVELLPRSTKQPDIGWPITLPAAGAFASTGGGVIIDPFSGQPVALRVVPRADPENWQRYLDQAHAAYRQSAPCRHPPARPRTLPANSHSRIDPRTREFLAGRVQEGQRADSAYASACNLLGVGMCADEVRRLILDGAAACGLPAVEAKNAVASAITTLRRRGRP